MTTQEAYEQIKEFFSRPGAELARDSERHEYVPSTVGAACFYRMPGRPSVRCAVGCLIPDDVYREEMEGTGVVDIVADYHISVLQGVDLTFLREVQRRHDVADSVEQFLSGLHLTATSYGLI